MNIRTSFVLLAVLTVVFISTATSSAYADHIPTSCVNCPEVDSGRSEANEILLKAMPISVGTDKTSYGHNDIITVQGKVANVSGFPVTLVVSSPLNSIVTIAQMAVDDDGNFSTTLNTRGDLWKRDGTYTIKVNYGTAQKSDKVLVEISGEASIISTSCLPSELSLKDDHCIPYTISNGMVTGTIVNNNDNSIIIKITTTDDGTLTLDPSADVLDGVFMVYVDGEEWSDVVISGNHVTINFPEGTESIEVVGTFVIPEFGTIAVMILAVAIISIIAVSAKSRLYIMPRY